MAANMATIKKAFAAAQGNITFNLDMFNEILLRWMIQANISFVKIQHPYFRLLCRYLVACSATYNLLDKGLTTHSTIKGWILALYTESRFILKESMATAPTDGGPVHPRIDIHGG